MDLEEAKKQKLQELRKKQLEEQAQAEAEAKISLAVKSLLEEQARTRLNNVKLVNKELYFKAVQAILYLQRAGQLQGKLSEDALKNLLDRLRDKREIKIKRK